VTALLGVCNAFGRIEKERDKSAVTNLLYLARMDDGLTGKARELLTIADKELQRLSHLAARSLKFYRQRTSPTTTPFEEILESVLFFHERRMKTAGIQLERRYKWRLRYCACRGELQQVFTNLENHKAGTYLSRKTSEIWDSRGLLSGQPVRASFL
jgi:signal transduction histidine kinase